MDDLYERPWNVSDDEPRHFYHTMEIPGAPVQWGQWDLRQGVDAYLAGESFEGLRVLEIGTANGFVCFELEKRGAEVIAFDLADGRSYDVIPAKVVDQDKALAEHSQGIRLIKNAFWWAHRHLRSRARVVYGHANQIPTEIGPVDCVFMGNVLQHLENPFGALRSAVALTERIIVTETNWRPWAEFDREPMMYFLPALQPDREKNPLEWCFSWWQVSPQLLETWLDLLGFRVRNRSTHEQFLRDNGTWVPHFTITAERA